MPRKQWLDAVDRPRWAMPWMYRDADRNEFMVDTMMTIGMREYERADAFLGALIGLTRDKARRAREQGPEGIAEAYEADAAGWEKLQAWIDEQLPEYVPGIETED